MKDHNDEASCTTILKKYECPCAILGTFTHTNTGTHNQHEKTLDQYVNRIYVISHICCRYIFHKILWCSFKCLISINICNCHRNCKKGICQHFRDEEIEELRAILLKSNKISCGILGIWFQILYSFFFSDSFVVCRYVCMLLDVRG